MNQASRRKYEAELQRLDDEIASLEAHWQHVPRFALCTLLAPLMWIAHSFAAGFVTLSVTAALVGTRAYLIGVRVSENRWTRDSLQRELARTDEREPAPDRGGTLGQPAHV